MRRSTRENVAYQSTFLVSDIGNVTIFYLESPLVAGVRDLEMINEVSWMTSMQKRLSWYGWAKAAEIDPFEWAFNDLTHSEELERYADCDGQTVSGYSAARLAIGATA
jgi:hypothetical protein